jgi:hypothetical protein
MDNKNFRFTALLALLILCMYCSAGTVTPFNANDKEIAQALKSLNDYRARAGLKPVKLSIELSKGCYNHALYAVKNRGKAAVAGLSVHYEIDTLPFATRDGNLAGRSSCIAYVHPEEAIAQFMNTFYHRMPLIDPGTTEVGIGYYTEDYSTVCCVDMRNAWKWNNDTGAHVVIFPEEHGFDTPRDFQKEYPNPIPDSISWPGFPVTIQFFRMSGLKNAQAKFTDNKGHTIDCLLSTPDNPLTDFPQWNTVCIIPKNRLEYNTTYTVDFSCIIDGKPFKKKWDFYTTLYIGNG